MKIIFGTLSILCLFVVTGCQSKALHQNWDSYYKNAKTENTAVIAVDKSNAQPFTDYNVVIDRKLVLDKNTTFELFLTPGVHDIQMVIERFKYIGLKGEKQLLHRSISGWYRVKLEAKQQLKLDTVKRQLFYKDQNGEFKEIFINRKAE